MFKGGYGFCDLVVGLFRVIKNALAENTLE